MQGTVIVSILWILLSVYTKFLWYNYIMYMFGSIKVKKCHRSFNFLTVVKSFKIKRC